jgi:glycine hydroxymethyltransferase
MSIPTDSPHDATKNPSGIRIGTQELTRWGMNESEMTVVADFFKEALIEKRSACEIRKDVTEFKEDFNKISYCFAE